jgi:hypothetical protein
VITETPKEENDERMNEAQFNSNGENCTTENLTDNSEHLNGAALTHVRTIVSV